MPNVATAKQNMDDVAAPRRRGDLHCHLLDGEAILYDAAFNTTYRLNDTAYRVWRLCDGERDLNAIAHRVCEIYCVEMAQATEDVHTLVDQMRAQGLLRDAEGGAW